MFTVRAPAEGGKTQIQEVRKGNHSQVRGLHLEGRES